PRDRSRGGDGPRGRRTPAAATPARGPGLPLPPGAERGRDRADARTERRVGQGAHPPRPAQPAHQPPDEPGGSTMTHIDEQVLIERLRTLGQDVVVTDSDVADARRRFRKSLAQPPRRRPGLTAVAAVAAVAVAVVVTLVITTLPGSHHSDMSAPPPATQ